MGGRRGVLCIISQRCCVCLYVCEREGDFGLCRSPDSAISA